MKEIENAKAYWSSRGYDVTKVKVNIRGSTPFSKPVIGFQVNDTVTVYRDKAEEYGVNLDVAIAHEIGHYLGFRHYDSSHAIMRGAATQLRGMKL